VETQARPFQSSLTCLWTLPRSVGYSLAISLFPSLFAYFLFAVFPAPTYPEMFVEAQSLNPYVPGNQTPVSALQGETTIWYPQTLVSEDLVLNVEGA